ncbi:MAG: cell division protein ZapA [Syntrophaceae bacterium]|jgi:cell division protein ZapA|nr:cell division protein ZapA [Syntrophaceae bacterium]
MKNLVRVEILGREYTIRSDEGEERVKKIAQYVNEKLTKITESAKTISSHNAAILAALDIANDYFEVLEGRASLVQKVEKMERQTGRLIEIIDSKIQ